MTGRRLTAGFALLTTSLIGVRTVDAYAGLGRTMVEQALGRVPESEDELDREIDRLQEVVDAAEGTASSPNELYSLAVLELNRPKSVQLDDIRRRLATVMLQAPEREDALDLWMYLNPRPTELRLADGQLGERLAQQPRNASLLWARARVQAALEDRGGARDIARDLALVDPSYGPRCHWLLAVVAGEDKKDEKATEHFEAALESLDDPTASAIWATSRLIAEPGEVARWDTTADDERADFLRTFWKRRDTFPLTAENERLGEHLRRLVEARQRYSLQSNGRAYLSMHDTFKFLSPDLDFYSSDVVFDSHAHSAWWLDHRGLVFVRHGSADRAVRSAIGIRSESWLFYRWTSRPLLFHFIDRRGVGEYVITLNLAQATTRGAVSDTPAETAREILNSSIDFREIYGTRGAFHMVFQRIATVRSKMVLEDMLIEEARMMSGFAREAFLDDTSNLIDEDDLLPFAAYSANFKAGSTNSDGEERVDTHLYYAIPEKELTDLGTAFEFDATVVVYDREWTKEIASGEHHFRYERAPTHKPSKEDLLVGVITLEDLEPGTYRFAFEIRERKTDKIGVTKGGLQVDYYGPGWVDLSDLLIAQKITPAGEASIFDRNGKHIIPIPTRTLARKVPAEVYYEIYDLQQGADGMHHYRVEYRLLEIQAKPSLMSRLFGIGMNIAYVFFPYQIFLAQAGLFGLDVATTDPEKGLTTSIEERNAPPGDGAVSESFKLDANLYRPGIYQMYVTVKDHVSGSISSRSVRFAID